MKKVIFSIFLALIFSSFAKKEQIRSNTNYVLAAKHLDSLILNSESIGLHPATYQSSFLDSVSSSQFLMKDSMLVKKKIQKIAINFFKDFRYGSHKPYLRYQGFDFDLKELAFQNRVIVAIEKQNVIGLYQQILNSESKEVKTLLQVQKDSIQWDTKKKKWIANAIHEFRWLAQVKKNYPLVLINIPAAELTYYDKGNLTLQMKTVVGRPKKPSKTLSSKIKNMILFPLWNVPRNISIEELVPEIQKNIRYFYASHLEIFTNKGKKVDPEVVPWKRLNANYFPYEMVQRTGYWNTLGLLKFQFDNPFKMYLHDTSEKKLFAKSRRFYSHSCIRLEKPLELGKLLLNGNAIALDTLNPNTKQVDVPPIYLKVKRNIPIIIWYSTVDFTAEGKVRILEDVYGRL